MVHARRLHLRFAAATLAVIAVAGAALLWAVQHEEVRQSERNVGAQTEYIAKSILKDELKPSDLAAPVTGARRAQLDWLFNKRVLVERRPPRQALPGFRRTGHVLERADTDRRDQR